MKDFRLAAYGLLGIFSLIGYELVKSVWPSPRVKLLNKVAAKKIPVVIRFVAEVGHTIKIGSFAECFHAYIIAADDETVVVSYTEDDTKERRIAMIAQKQIMVIVVEDDSIAKELMGVGL